MHKSLLTVLSLLCAVSIAGCTRSTDSNHGAPPDARPVSDVPAQARLVYSYAANQVYGNGVATDAWNHAEDTGFFVLEFVCDRGSIRQMELRRMSGGAVVVVQNIEEDGVFQTDIVTEAAGEYTLYFGKAEYFGGGINVYFVSDTEDSVAG